MKQNLNSSFSSRHFRNGAYSSAVTVIVLVVLLVVNMLISKLDLKIDISDAGYFTMSDTTKDFLKNLQHDIKIYYLVSEGREDTMIKDMVDKYDSASSHISVEIRDFELYPNFVYQYVDQDTVVYHNSVIIEDTVNGRSKYVPYSKLIQTTYNQQTMQSSLTGYDVEGQITSAIQYVTSENLPKVYMTEGHGEAELSSYATEYLNKQNIEMEKLETLTMEAVPEDCQALIIVGGNMDFTESEVEKIQEYLTAGGKAVFYLDYAVDDRANLKKLMEHYGITIQEGIVLEGDSKHMMNDAPFMIVPDTQEHELTENCQKDKKYVVSYMPVGVTADSDIRGSVERTPLLMTSDSSFSKINLEEGTFAKEEGDLDGPFCLGVAVTEDYNDVTTKLVVYSSSALLNDTFMGVSSVGNATLFMDTLNWVTERQDTVLSIPSKEFSQKYLTLTSAEANRLTILLVVLLPLAIVICGGVVWFKRRQK